jgi:uncharacterized ferredoxin-like protein
MVAAARTAPKTRGIDNIVLRLITDKGTIRKLAASMRRISKSEKRPSLERDAGNIEGLKAVVLVGVKDNPAGLNCAFCGYRDCQATKAAKGICALNSVDLGIAVGSSVSIASRFHIDNRIMYSIGLAASRLGLFPRDVRQILGIPLSVSGKNPFFDRK